MISRRCDSLAGLLVCAASASVAVACGKPAETTQTPIEPRQSTSASALASQQQENVGPPRPRKGSLVRLIADDAPLEEGAVAFEGVLRPVKGGYDVRGVTLDQPELARWMAAANDATPKEPEWFVGARVRVNAVLTRQDVKPQEGELPMQMKTGTFFVAARIGEIVLVKNAEMIEGRLGRSKGMFTVAGHLITPDDLAWSLSPTGCKTGDRVRLRGQSRVYVCPKDAQCLIGGSLPLFDVGRAERMP